MLYFLLMCREMEAYIVFNSFFQICDQIGQKHNLNQGSLNSSFMFSHDIVAACCLQTCYATSRNINVASEVI